RRVAGDLAADRATDHRTGHRRRPAAVAVADPVADRGADDRADHGAAVGGTRIAALGSVAALLRRARPHDFDDLVGAQHLRVAVADVLLGLGAAAFAVVGVLDGTRSGRGEQHPGEETGAGAHHDVLRRELVGGVPAIPGVRNAGRPTAPG